MRTITLQNKHLAIKITAYTDPDDNRRKLEFRVDLPATEAPQLLEKHLAMKHATPEQRILVEVFSEIDYMITRGNTSEKTYFLDRVSDAEKILETYTEHSTAYAHILTAMLRCYINPYRKVLSYEA